MFEVYNRVTCEVTAALTLRHLCHEREEEAASLTHVL